MKMEEKTIDYGKFNTLPRAILFLVGTGAILAAALIAPNMLRLLKPLLREGKRSNYERERIRQAVRSLRQRRLVSRAEKNGKAYLRVTSKGKTYMKQLELTDMKLPQRPWDHRWRLIFFDIPEECGKARRAFRLHLTALGCLPVQRSVLIYPHECRDEIDFVASFWEVEPYVHYAVTDDLGKLEGQARKHFGFL